jgi:hypothetical protein
MFLNSFAEICAMETMQAELSALKAEIASMRHDMTNDAEIWGPRMLCIVAGKVYQFTMLQPPVRREEYSMWDGWEGSLRMRACVRQRLGDFTRGFRSHGQSLRK